MELEELKTAPADINEENVSNSGIRSANVWSGHHSEVPLTKAKRLESIQNILYLYEDERMRNAEDDQKTQ